MTDVDVYFSFRSPYSYLATPGMLQIKKNYDINLILRPILPVAIRTPETLFSAANAPRARYIQLDWPRRARFLDMSDKWPSPDPIVQNMETLQIADEQPHIFHLTHLGIEAERRGKGIEFAKQVSHLIFGGTRNWHRGRHMTDAAARAGLWGVLGYNGHDSKVSGGDAPAPYARDGSYKVEDWLNDLARMSQFAQQRQ